MYIYWLGESSFKIKTNDTTIIIDPADKKTGIPQSKFEAEIVLVSGTLSVDLKRVQSSKDKPFVIASPGEYEHHGVFVYGIPSGNSTTLYLIKAEDVTIAHLSGLTNALIDKQLELFEGAHIALVPVGGEGALNAQQAESLISQIEPHIVIPMNYQIPKLAIPRNPVDSFLKEMGEKEIKPETSLAIKRSALPDDDKVRIVLLQP